MNAQTAAEAPHAIQEFHITMVPGSQLRAEQPTALRSLLVRAIIAESAAKTTNSREREQKRRLVEGLVDKLVWSLATATPELREFVLEFVCTAREFREDAYLREAIELGVEMVDEPGADEDYGC